MVAVIYQLQIKQSNTLKKAKHYFQRNFVEPASRDALDRINSKEASSVQPLHSTVAR